MFISDISWFHAISMVVTFMECTRKVRARQFIFYFVTKNETIYMMGL